MSYGSVKRAGQRALLLLWWSRGRLFRIWLLPCVSALGKDLLPLRDGKTDGSCLCSVPLLLVLLQDALDSIRCTYTRICLLRRLYRFP